MAKKQNFLLLAFKGIIVIYLPVILIAYIIYKVILGRDMNISFDRMFFYAAIIGLLAIRNYARKSREIDILDLSSLKQLIEAGRWQIIGYNDTWLLIKPKFDFPFRMFFDDTVHVNYCDQHVTLQGAWYYISNLEKDIRGKGSFWANKTTSISLLILIILLVIIPL